MAITLDELQTQIPYYLTAKAKEGLLKALTDFPSKMNYYTESEKEALLQGDGWNCLDVVSFENGQRKAIKGIILSNSCDISSENKRSLPVRIVFAPIIPLQLYIHNLRKNGTSEDGIKSKIHSITEQKVTSIFYLPKGASLEEDYIAVLDDIHNIPASIFMSNTERKKSFTLSLEGFYIFLFKLSIHFCRFHENELRGYEELPA